MATTNEFLKARTQFIRLEKYELGLSNCTTPIHELNFKFQQNIHKCMKLDHLQLNPKIIIEVKSCKVKSITLLTLAIVTL